MPFYEFRCGSCGRTEEVFTRSMSADVRAPECTCGDAAKQAVTMERKMSAFVRQRTYAEQVEEAEAKFGKEVDDAMGASPDIDTHARHYDAFAGELPPE